MYIDFGPRYSYKCIQHTILGAAISWVKSWAKIVGTFLKNCANKNRLQAQDDLESEIGLQVTQSRLDKCTDNTDDLESCCTQQISPIESNISPKTELNIKSPQDGPNVIPSMMVINEAQILKESLEAVYQQLDEIKQNNATQLKMIKEQHTETEKQIEKKDKETKEAIKLQHRETRRRLERLEKKTNSGYFN